MQTLINFIQEHLFPVISPSFAIPTLLWFIISLCIMIYYVRVDLKHHEIEKMFPIILCWIPSVLCGYALYGLTIDLVVGFFTLFLVFYLVELRHEILHNRNLAEADQTYAVGTPDILIAPVYTVWFGWGVTIYLVLLMLVFCVFTIPPIQSYIQSKYVKSEDPKFKNYIPIMPCLFISYIIFMAMFFLLGV